MTLMLRMLVDLSMRLRIWSVQTFRYYAAHAEPLYLPTVKLLHNDDDKGACNQSAPCILKNAEYLTATSFAAADTVKLTGGNVNSLYRTHLSNPYITKSTV
ncbi:hypothetical protein M422DRAFT_276112 [Sphaerobolus stellatus SS14]|uniref:Uncharacterized protein n=1 Tax=Sphaerobolus stellatus (strain SS14) TaxID=990650 RepID=A0A0C9UD12_SPHS4|nr:hypothetical protein M422DRAFT_276112 [Sphaerobolus stellatus SS14]